MSKRKARKKAPANTLKGTPLMMKIIGIIIAISMILVVLVPLLQR